MTNRRHFAQVGRVFHDTKTKREHGKGRAGQTMAFEKHV